MKSRTLSISFRMHRSHQMLFEWLALKGKPIKKLCHQLDYFQPSISKLCSIKRVTTWWSLAIICPVRLSTVYRMQVESLIICDELDPVYTYTRISWNNKHDSSTRPQQEKVSVTFWVCGRFSHVSSIFILLSRQWFKLLSSTWYWATARSQC